ncbi:MAG: hypothetical protein WC810_25265, partial [Janthinobacterium sp.]
MLIWEKIKKVLKKEDVVKKLQLRVWELEKNAVSPTKVLENVFKRGVVFYDYDNIEDKTDKINYYKSIQLILNNDAFWNEYNHCLADMIQEVATSEDDRHRDKMLRFSINGLEVFKE